MEGVSNLKMGHSKLSYYENKILFVFMILKIQIILLIITELVTNEICQGFIFIVVLLKVNL